MTFGIQIYDSSSILRMDTDSTMGRIVGSGTASWAAGETGAKVVTISGLVSTDEVVFQVLDTVFSSFTTSISGTDITLTRGSPGSAAVLNVLCIAVRLQ
jgi:hypothetical protein